MFPFTVILLYDFNRYVIIIIYLSYKIPNPLGHCFLFVSEHCWERFKPHNGRDWLIIYQPFAFFFFFWCSGRRYFPDFFTIVWLCGLFQECKVTEGDVYYLQAWIIKTSCILFCMHLPIYSFNADKCIKIRSQEGRTIKYKMPGTLYHYQEERYILIWDLDFI